MGRYSHSVDLNQPEIIEAFQRCGCSVLSLAPLGGGAGDLLVARNGVTIMVEVKSATGNLRPSQIDFRAEWKGRYEVVRTVKRAVEIAMRMV